MNSYKKNDYDNISLGNTLQEAENKMLFPESLTSPPSMESSDAVIIHRKNNNKRVLEMNTQKIDDNINNLLLGNTLEVVENKMSVPKSLTSTFSFESDDSVGINNRKNNMDDNLRNFKKRKHEKSVRFDSYATVYSSKRTEEDLFATWYSKAELAVIKGYRKDFVKALQKVNFNLGAVDKSRYCPRGYEAYFSVDANKATRWNRVMTIKRVLQEQQRQRDNQIHDTRSMENLSCHLTQRAKDRAMELGFQDANDSCLSMTDHLADVDDGEDDCRLAYSIFEIPILYEKYSPQNANGACQLLTTFSSTNEAIEVKESCAKLSCKKLPMPH